LYIVTAQKGPGRHIVHPGQDVELLCIFNDLVIANTTLGAGWEINHVLYGVNALHNGQLRGYSANGKNIIVENIMMNDDRNGSNYRCVIFNIINNDMREKLNESDPIILYVAGEYVTCTFNSNLSSYVSVINSPVYSK